MSKKRTPESSRRTWLPPDRLLLAAILLLAALLRFGALTSIPPGLCYDESINGVNAMEALETGAWKVFYPDNHGREGLFINIQAAFIRIVQLFSSGSRFDLEPWMLRFPSAVLGLLTVAGLYLLARSLFNSTAVAVASSFFLATSFWHVNFSRIGFRAISAPLWLVWSLYFLIEGFRDMSGNSSRRGLRKVALAGLLYGAGFHSYIAYRATILIALAALAWLVWKEWSRDRRPLALRCAGLFLAAALLAAAPLGIHFLQNPGSFAGRTSQLSILDSPEPARLFLDNLLKTALMFNLEGDAFWRHNIAGRPQLFLPVGLLFLAGIALAFRRSAPGVICLLWLAAAAAPVVFSRHDVPHALRGLLMTPACFLLAGLAAARLWDFARARFSPAAAATAASAFALVLAWECYASYFGSFAKAEHLRTAFEIQWSELAREVNRLPDSQPKYIVIPGWQPDARGVPDSAYPFALLTGSFTEKGRIGRRIRFIDDPAEAARIAEHEPGYTFVLSGR